MYIKNNYPSLQNGDCNECQHEHICKFVVTRKATQEKISQIELEPGSPYKVSCYCDGFTKKPSGLIPGQRD